MRIFNSEAAIRLNGAFGSTPDMASIWFASNGNVIGGYNNGGVHAYINFSPSIPQTYIGFDIKTAVIPNQPGSGGAIAWRQISAVAGFGVNAGGTSLAPNNQNYEWYTGNSEGPSGGPANFSFEGGNRRIVWGYGSTDFSMVGLCYFRVTCRYINFVTITFP